MRSTFMTRSNRLFIGLVFTVSFLLLPLIVLPLSGCSKSSGSGTEEGDLTSQDLALGQEERFGSGNIPEARAGSDLVQDVHFGYDSSAVQPQERDKIKQASQYILKDSTLFVEVEGHCDKRGTNEYNLALGEERAKAVASILVSSGVPANRVSTISYGEEIPLDPADNEAAYAKNRRAHFALYRKEDKRR